MKRFTTILTLLLLFGQTLVAQTNLTDALKPTDERRCSRFTSKEKQFCIARYPYRGGFVLKTGLGGLISSDNPGGHVVYNLGGAYDKLTFVMGPYGGEYHGPNYDDLNGPNSAGDGSNVIVTVRGDGRTLLDEVVWNHDAPREVTLDVKGVCELRFDVMRGETSLAVSAARLWKAGQRPTAAPNPIKYPAGNLTLVKNLWPHYIRHSGWVAAITERDGQTGVGCHTAKSISINRVTYNTGLQFSLDQALIGVNQGWAYFWLQKKYDKLSFIVGPRDNQSSRASAWIIVKADGKIIYEKEVKQTDLAEQVVLDIKGVNQLAFFGQYANSDFLGTITCGVVNITAYPAGATNVPTPGEVNGSKGRISKLPDVCAMCSNIPPYSVRGVSSHSNTYFDGSSRHYTFSMGGEQFWEGFILTTGTTLFDDNINSFASFDLAGEYDWISFTAGCLTQRRVLDDDIIRVYADDKLILETTIHALEPNKHFELPINRCRTLKFVKPGNGQSKQTYFGIADVVLYRGKPRPNDLFVHEKPDCPPQADLIDLCRRPYFHYVGRYLSTLTNFDFNDCFKNGSSQREFFQMKDGSKIYKGIMLETNIPLGLEDISLSTALVSLIAGPVIIPTPVLGLVSSGGGQSSAAAFNPYREYESVTFTVANKAEYVDPFNELFADGKMPPVTLYVIADQMPVAEITLHDKMMPTTYTVPIHKCEQLLFWLQCGDVRSGQYVLYDMTLDKRVLPQTPSSLVKTRQAASGQKTAEQPSMPAPKPEAPKPTKDKKEKSSKPKKEKPAVVWTYDKLSGNKSIDDYIKAVDEVWNATVDMLQQSAPNYQIRENYVQSKNGTIYRAVSFVNNNGRISIQELLNFNDAFANIEKNIKMKIIDADLYLPTATLAVASLTTDIIKYGKLIKLGGQATAQCRRQASEITEMKKQENDTINEFLRQALTVDGIQSTDRTLLLALPAGQGVPAGVSVQQLQYYNMN